MSDSKLTIRLVADGDGVRAGLKRAEGHAKKSGKKAGKGFSVSFTKQTDLGLKNIGARLAGIGAAVATAFSFNKAVQAAAKVETLSTQFRTLLGSTKAAREQMEKLSEFSARTPFQLEGIAKASRSLLAFGFTQEKSISLLEGLGDAAAASGADLGELTLIFGKVAAAGKLTGRRLLQMQQRAIPIIRALADTMQVSEAAVTKMITQGKVDFKTFEKAFLSLSAKGKVFSGGMETLSKTVSGRFSTLKDNVFLAMADIGKAFEPLTKKILVDSITEVQNFRKAFDFNQIVIDVIEFGIAFNKYLTIPIMGIVDTVSLAFSGVAVVLQMSLDGLVKLAGAALNALPNIGGVFDEPLEALATFSDATTERLDQMKKDLGTQFDNSFNDSLQTEATAYLENLRALALESNKIVDDISVLDPLNGTVDKIQKALPTVTNVFKSIDKNFAGSAKSMRKTSDEMGKSVSKSMLTSLGGGVSKAFESFGSALAKGENAMEAFGKSLIGMIGSIAIQLGTAFIAQGIAWSVNPPTVGSGAPLIAAGAALVTVGGAIKALSGGKGGVGSSSASASAGGVASIPDNSDQSDTSSEILDDPEFENQGPRTNVNLTINGNILDSQESGLHLLELLNNSFDTSGAVLSSNARFA